MMSDPYSDLDELPNGIEAAADYVQGSSPIQHLAHVAHRKDVWSVANGWLHCYRYVAEHAQVVRQP